MKIITLMENTCGAEGGLFEHGLSLYIETKKHKLLMDTGASDGFLKNAEILGIDLTAVDTVFLSHGHYDHSGGILAFSELNPSASIYMQRLAGGDYYHGERYIGIDKKILTLPQVKLLQGNCKLDEELSLFTDITGRRYYPQSNLELTKKEGEKEEQDSFAHEQCLVIEEGEEKVLISGCAHNGILNILDKYQELYQNAVVGIVENAVRSAIFQQTEIALAQFILLPFADVRALAGVEVNQFKTGPVV